MEWDGGESTAKQCIKQRAEKRGSKGWVKAKKYIKQREEKRGSKGWVMCD